MRRNYRSTGDIACALLSDKLGILHECSLCPLFLIDYERRQLEVCKAVAIVSIAYALERLQG